MLRQGARIGLIATSHRYFDEPYAAGKAWLESQGYKWVEFGLGEPHRYFASTDEQRLSGLVQAFTDPQIDAVWAIRGGSGVTRLLPHVNIEAFRPVPLIGFSDLTPLLDRLGRAGRPAIHGPVVHSLGRTDADSLAHLADLLAGRSTAPLVGATMVPGRVTAPIVGGNLCMVASTCGTPDQLDGSGRIVLLEEIGETPYKVDRMLTQLVQAGVFRGVAGVALGQFTGCAPPKGVDWTLHHVFAEHLSDLGVPVVTDLPIGHGAQNRAFALHQTASIHQDTLTLSPPSRT
ncbi:MAG: LD-carboxypeptidase [Myxococcota bacterium]